MRISSTMVFLSPWFLLGLSALAAPIAIHLIFRRKVRQVRFPSVRLLLEITRRYSSRQRLQELAVLALRCTAVGALAFALARPTLRTTSVTAASCAAAIVIDDSFSMAYKQETISDFERALGHVQEVLSQMSRRDSVGVILLSDPERLITAADPSLVAHRLRGTEVSHRVGDMRTALRKAVEFLKSARRSSRFLILVGDLQESTWSTLYELSTVREIREAGAELVLVDVGRRRWKSVAVRDGRVGRDVLRPQELRVSATLVNYGDRPHTVENALTWARGDRPGHPVEVPAHGEATITFNVPQSRLAGASPARVVISGDGLEPDNEWHLVLARPRATPVLVVNGDPSDLPEFDEAFYLRWALQPRDPGSGAALSDVEADVTTPAALGGLDLSRRRVVILANVARLGAQAGARLARYLAKGGGLIIFCGERMRAASWNEWLTSVSGPRLLEKKSHEPALRFGRADLSHPVFSPLAAVAGDTLPLARFRRTQKLDLRGAETLARFTDNSPALVEWSVGPGRVLLFTSTCDRDWNNLPVRTVFLPMVQSMTRYVAGEKGEGVPLVGEEVVLQTKEAAATLYDPRRRKRETKAVEKRGRYEIRFVPDVPGVWTLEEPAGEGEPPVRRLVPVNLPAGEGDLRGVEPRRLKVLPRLHHLVRHKAVGEYVRRLRTGVELWNFFLILALAAFVAELFLANRRLPGVGTRK